MKKKKKTAMYVQTSFCDAVACPPLIPFPGFGVVGCCRGL